MALCRRDVNNEAETVPGHPPLGLAAWCHPEKAAPLFR